MAEHERKSRLIVDGVTSPKLPGHVKLRHDAGRGRWIMLAPERVLQPDDVSVAILKLCDGSRSIDEISAVLAEEYSASVDEIRQDVIEFLQDMADRGYIEG
ncbi:MAG: pyrroloquinoline quinone biosynthesis peptide chaperone PqqD [Hyphomicrobiaceae bacterium]